MYLVMAIRLQPLALEQVCTLGALGAWYLEHFVRAIFQVILVCVKL